MNLESSLIISLLVLTAAATLFSLGDAIACLYAKEAGQVTRMGFWASQPAVTAGTGSTGQVSWEMGGSYGPYRVLRVTKSLKNSLGETVSPEDYEDWDNLGEFAASPATGLTVAADDIVVVAYDVAKCGFKLVGPRRPATDMVLSPKAYYAGMFGVQGTQPTTHSDDYVAVFDEDFNVLWSGITRRDADGEQCWNNGYAAVSSEHLYLSTIQGFYGISRISLSPETSSPRTQDVVPATSAGYSLGLSGFTVSADGKSLFALGRSADTKFHLLGIPTASGVARDLGVLPFSSWNCWLSVGRDGNLYANYYTTDSGGSNRLLRFDKLVTDAGGTLVPDLTVDLKALAAGNRPILHSVDAQGNAFFKDYYIGGTWKLPAGGSALVPLTGSEAGGLGGAFNAMTRSGTPIYPDGASYYQGSGELNKLRSLPDGSVLKDPLFPTPQPGHTINAGTFSSPGGTPTFVPASVDMGTLPPVTQATVDTLLRRVVLTAADVDGITATYYMLDGGPQTPYAGPIALTGTEHTLLYWSVDRTGNTETKNSVPLEDAVPPLTSASVIAGAGSFTLAATDAGYGVATTHYELDGGATTTYAGKVSGLAVGNHTLEYWSVDRAGNVEARKTANFDVPLAAEFTWLDNGDGTWTCNGYTGTATEIWIPATHQGQPVTGVDGHYDPNLNDGVFAGNWVAWDAADGAMDNKGDWGNLAPYVTLETIHIPEGVTTIGASQYGFEYQERLVSVDLPSTVTSIGNYSFWGNSMLAALYVPDSTTSLGSNVFVGCSSLVLSVPSHLGASVPAGDVNTLIVRP